MLIGNAIDSLTTAVTAAKETDLYPLIDTMRPDEEHIQVLHFIQTWGSTAIGFGGFGGQGLTAAYTTIVFGPQGDACVYFNGRLAYHVNRPNDEFGRDVERHRMTSVGSHMKYEHQA